MLDYIKYTDDPAEMIEIAKKIVQERQDLYTDSSIISSLDVGTKRIMAVWPNHSYEEVFYRSIYDYWVYGAGIDNELYLRFYEKKHTEKIKYFTLKNGFLYFNHLNDINRFDDITNKWNAYQHLREFYKRDIILISSELDYEKFCEFVQKHPDFVVKPTNLSLGLGVHTESVRGLDYRQVFEKILGEKAKTGRDFHSVARNVVPTGTILLEELIEQDPTLASLHPSSVNCIRCTTIHVNNKVHLFYPWIKIGINNMFITSGGGGSICAGIDKETGIINTIGYTELGQTYEYNPTTGVKIKGFAIPQWKELLEMLEVIGRSFEGINYIGWDMALSKKGWCVVEGNYAGGATIFQLTSQKGLKDEFEELIGWKPDKRFWWEK